MPGALLVHPWLLPQRSGELYDSVSKLAFRGAELDLRSLGIPVRVHQTREQIHALLPRGPQVDAWYVLVGKYAQGSKPRKQPADRPTRAESLAMLYLKHRMASRFEGGGNFFVGRRDDCLPAVAISEPDTKKVGINREFGFRELQRPAGRHRVIRVAAFADSDGVDDLLRGHHARPTAVRPSDAPPPGRSPGRPVFRELAIGPRRPIESLARRRVPCDPLVVRAGIDRRAV
ncbi:hypothetical protein RCO28_30775 [Streptomyces sp. LHD-70]|nr:hypothetical protein [Streptomyces sp. LHD-70]MDQ8706822.1 hypothetical protein [Streptomyces sp. LHD-70]